MPPDQDALGHVHELAKKWELGTYVWKPGSEQLAWSPELVRIYGLTQAPNGTKGFMALVHPEDRVRVEAETSTYLGAGHDRYSHSFRIVRPDGAVRVMLDRGAIERDPIGYVTVVRGINIDITNENQIQDHYYRSLFAALDEGFCLLEVKPETPGGRIDYRVVEANQAFYDKTGFPKTILGRWLREVAPDLEEHWYQAYGRVARTGEPIRFEQHSQMLGRWFDVYAFSIGDPQDNRVAVLFSDVSDHKLHEEQTRLLMHEANHRFKNVLSVVQSIARQMKTSNADNFVDRFTQRVQALSTAQDLLFQHTFQTVPFVDLVQNQLGHFAEMMGSRIALTGPPLMMAPDATQAFGMALHELATNAAKYGALSNETGCVDINWTIAPGATGEAVFMLSWRERGGPQVVTPERYGFGSTVTTRMIKASTEGEVDVQFAPEGLSWRLSCPAANVVGGED